MYVRILSLLILESYTGKNKNFLLFCLQKHFCFFFSIAIIFFKLKGVGCTSLFSDLSIDAMDVSGEQQVYLPFVNSCFILLACLNMKKRILFSSSLFDCQDSNQ